MRPTEARWLRDALATLPAQDLSPLLELGSSTLEFRTVDKPHIERDLHKPLRDRGVRIVCVDLKDAPGVEIAGDLYTAEVQAKLRATGARSLVCANILEHVEDRAGFAQVCDALVPSGGYLVVTVPHSYPLHLDPIDTYYRPTPQALLTLFPDYEIVLSEVVRDQTYLQEIAERPWPERARIAARRVKTLVSSMPGSRRWVLANHRLTWLFRPYEITCAVLRKH